MLPVIEMQTFITILPSHQIMPKITMFCQINLWIPLDSLTIEQIYFLRVVSQPMPAATAFFFSPVIITPVKRQEK